MVCLFVCMCAAVGNQYNPFPAQRAELEKHYTFPSLPLVCSGCTHTQTHTHTAMPTCLSIRFYHHRDTVDSSFVRSERIGALRTRTTAFILIYKSSEYASVCVCFCLLAETHTQKGQGCELLVELKKKGCVFFSMWKSAHSLLSGYLFLCVDVPVSAWAAQHIQVSGCCVSKKERGQILTLSLCVINNLNPVRQRAAPPLPQMNSLSETLNVLQAEWMVAKRPPFWK